MIQPNTCVCSSHHANLQQKRIRVASSVRERLRIEPETDNLREKKRAFILFHPLF